jgi:tetratricopeptide (TPR) repeat protein
LNKEFPNLPLGKIYLAANRIAEAYDYAEDFDGKFILKRLEEAKEQSEKLIDSDNENIWYQYFLALTEGYTAYFHAINESWFSALSTGVDAISEFDKILASDKKFYEAYIAIGTFEYWKSRKMEFIDWLPFNIDSRKIGIERLKVAIDSSSYNSYLAINSLIWIYIDQNRFDDAIKISEKALKEFPDSRTFKWGLARAYEEIDPSKAIALYIEILNSYPVLENGNYKNVITLKHIIAQQYVKLGDKQNALKYCNEILSIKNIPEKTADELAERLERVKSLKNELTK